MSKKETRAVSISTRAAAEHTTSHTTTQCDGNSRHPLYPKHLTQKQQKTTTPNSIPQRKTAEKIKKNKMKNRAKR